MSWFGFYTFDARTGDVLRRGVDWRCTPRCWLLNFVAAKPIPYGPGSRRWGSGGAPTRWLAPFEPLEVYADVAIAERAGLDTVQVIDEGDEFLFPCSLLCRRRSRLVGVVAAALLAIASSVLAIAASASPEWLVHVEDSGIRHEYGLFNACVVELGTALRCSAATEANGWDDAALNRGRSAGAVLAVLATLVFTAGALLQLARLALAMLLYHPSLGERVLGGTCQFPQRAVGSRRSSMVALEGGSDGFIELGGDEETVGGQGAAAAMGRVDAGAEEDAEEEGAGAAVSGSSIVGFLEDGDVLEGSGGGADDRSPGGVPVTLRAVLRAVAPQGMVAQAPPRTDLFWACALHTVGIVAACMHLLGAALLLACWCIWEGAAQPVLWAGDVADGVGAALAWCALAVSLAAFVAQQVVG